MKIYIAGKIGLRDWRHEVVSGLARVSERDDIDPSPAADRSLHPEILHGAVFGHDYVGPFFTGIEHGDYPEPGEHGAMSTSNGTPLAVDGVAKHGGDLDWIRENAERRVYAACASAIERCDTLYAWLDDLTAFGTLVEIGLAVAQKKYVVIGVDGKKDNESNYTRDVWFALTAATTVIRSPDGPAVPLRTICEWSLPGNPSFIETEFHRAWANLNPGIKLDFQHRALSYFIDFVHKPTMLAVELDGMLGHSSPADIEKDRRRQRELEALGYTFIRFGGREVTNDPHKCAVEVLDRINVMMGGR